MALLSNNQFNHTILDRTEFLKKIESSLFLDIIKQGNRVLQNTFSKPTISNGFSLYNSNYSKTTFQRIQDLKRGCAIAKKCIIKNL